MKKGVILTVLGTVFLLSFALLNAIMSPHHRAMPTSAARPDPCQSPDPEKRPDDCRNHGRSSGHGFYYRRSPNDRNGPSSGHEEAEAESAGHAGFGESAGGHSGSGGE